MSEVGLDNLMELYRDAIKLKDETAASDIKNRIFEFVESKLIKNKKRSSMFINAIASSYLDSNRIVIVPPEARDVQQIFLSYMKPINKYAYKTLYAMSRNMVEVAIEANKEYPETQIYCIVPDYNWRDPSTQMALLRLIEEKLYWIWVVKLNIEYPTDKYDNFNPMSPQRTYFDFYTEYK